MRRLTLFCLLVAAVVALRAQEPAAPASPPMFHAGTDVIPIDVTVLDAHRHPVRGLTAADFTVLVDGKPAQIQTFTAVDLPLLRSSGRRISPPTGRRWSRRTWRRRSRSRWGKRTKAGSS